MKKENDFQKQKNNILNLQKKCIRSFNQIEIPQNTTELHLSSNSITDFEGFIPNENIISLVVDNNPILSFKFFPKEQNIQIFSAINTPLSELPMFRLISLIIIGLKLKIINGSNVTSNEIRLVSEIGQFFTKNSSTVINQETHSRIRSVLSASFRKGYICSSFPKHLSTIEKEAQQYSTYPVSVQAAKLMLLLHKDQNETSTLIKQIFSVDSKRPKKKSQNFVMEEKLSRQQTLITFLMKQVQELKETKETKPKTIAEGTQNEEKALSQSTKDAYYAMVNDVALNLVENSNECESKALKNQEENNRYMLKKAVIKYLNADENTTNKKLAEMIHNIKNNQTK